MNLIFSWMTQILAGLSVNATGSGEQHHMNEAEEVTEKRLLSRYRKTDATAEIMLCRVRSELF